MAAAAKPTDRRGKCRFCLQEQAVAKNDTLADHLVSNQTKRLCFGSGMGPAK